MEAGQPSRRILLFARYPEKGRVKTRLETHLEQDEVLGLYKRFVEDILATLYGSGYPTTVCYWPPERGADMQAWLGPSLAYFPQKGGDIGERMQNAFAEAFAGGVDQAILMGTDFPDLEMGIIHEAFDGLSRNDMTLGPAADGGYYLIGFTRHAFIKEVFAGISWGTGRVFSETLEKIRSAAVHVHILPEWQDIDTFEDLEQFYKRAAQKGLESLRTVKYLKTIFS